ncbi:hypothetical protein [Parasitella parasitica]|uniref:Uncharacterized protein n=1 Tax=Parasitella parasitica TaxID=35722 RepID=A0A0B7NVG0_9FUNG|nr:hypothetical protein [Parasitella parasitica]
MLSRLSRLFSSSSSNTATPKSSSSSTTTTTAVNASYEPSHYNHSTVRQKHTDSNGTQKKSRWSTLGIGRKTKRQGIPVGEWLPPPLPIEKTTKKPAEKDTNRDSVISSTPSNVGCYYNEKVEIIVPSASINSFLSTTSNNSGHQHASIYFSSPCMSPQLEVDEHLHTPRTSIDDQESLKPEKPYAQVHGLGIMVNHILKDAFTVADHDIFDKDDFYD